MGTLTQRVVTRLSSEPTAALATYTNSGIAYDWAIGGLPFLAATKPDRPLERKTAPVRKDQFDATTDPGEQSLVFWWLRSQSSFHGGTGIKFQEADTADLYSQLVKYRFQDSRGLDVFSTKGQASLLKDTVTLKSSVASSVLIHGCTDSSDGSDLVYQAEGNLLYRVTAAGTSTAVTWGGTGTILSIADDGTNYYVLDNAGIWKGTLAGGAGSKIYASTATTGFLGWVKQRLVAGLGPSFYELDANSSGGAALPTAKYTHKNSSWVWTGITETPAAILASGVAGDNSEIFRFMLDTSGIVPMLSGAIATAVMPEGERVYGLYSYLGDYVAIGTDKGVRIANVDDNGNMQYGPITIPTTSAVRSFVGKDRFIYCAAESAIDGTSGLWVIDLGLQVQFRQYAYACNLNSGVSGQVNNVGLIGTTGRLVFSVNGHGSYCEHATNLASTGYLQTGNIRFHTIEPKLFKFLLVRCLPLAGSITASQVTKDGTVTNLATYSTAGSTDLDEIAFPSSLGKQEYINVKFTLARDAGLTTGPTLTGWQIKALPAQKRQRLFVIPLLCFDQEVDKNGQRVNSKAISRLEALEALEEAADIVNLQDLNSEPMTNRLAVIDDVDFKQTDPPGKFAGWGGVIYVTIRAVN